MLDYKYMLTLPEYIESFISDFKKDFGDENLVETAFTNGNCYHFAVIMETLFNGYVMYNPIENHFAFMDDKNRDLWDITGKLKDKSNYVLWSEYQRFDRLEAERITEQCMYKIYVG